jgi:hypothetical protein
MENITDQKILKLSYGKRNEILNIPKIVDADFRYASIGKFRRKY